MRRIQSNLYVYNVCFMIVTVNKRNYSNMRNK